MNDEQKKYAIVFHDDVVPMLSSHFQFLANVSPSAAQRLRDILYEGFASLKIMPYRCPIYRSHMGSDIYRRLIIGRYEVIFSINEAEGIVNIRYVLDSRQKPVS